MVADVFRRGDVHTWCSLVPVHSGKGVVPVDHHLPLNHRLLALDRCQSDFLLESGAVIAAGASRHCGVCERYGAEWQSRNHLSKVFSFPNRFRYMVGLYPRQQRNCSAAGVADFAPLLMSMYLFYRLKTRRCSSQAVKGFSSQEYEIRAAATEAPTAKTR
nr:hypothetical protein [Marinicella sp. W31]MDC2875946.1 hypothetical protein [Marinicella sp. W31]